MGVADTQNSDHNVHDAHAVSTMTAGVVRHSATLIVQDVCVDNFQTPLRALIDTGVSNNFVLAQVATGHGVSLPDAKVEMIIRLANESRMKMSKQVVRLAMKFEKFQSEDNYITLGLDDQFDIILRLPWLKHCQPSIDWMNVTIDVNMSCSATLCCRTTNEMV
ncbi:putative aspartic peptidase domain superfamily [Plasmopara halstedii]